jgi:Leucine-rich repeat (LRR) protein
LSGNVKDLGRGELKERGIVVSKSPKPTIDNMKFKSSVIDLGEYKIVVTKLEVNTKYYVRAYTQNEAGIVYGDEINFTTDNYTAPKVSTNDLQNISFTSLRAGLEIQSEGNTKVTDRGVVISTNPIPDLTDLKIQMGDGIGGEMRDITGLASNVTYYLRAYATNKWGTSYGDIRKFTTKDNTPPPPPVYVAPVYTPPTPTPSTPYIPAPVVSTPPPTLSALPEYVSVPDSRFEQALIDRGLDFVLDGRIKTAPIANATTIEILNPMGIVSIRGIEAFPNLQKIRIIHNEIGSVDLSKNPNLTWVSFWDNKLTSIDVSSLNKLEYFGAGDNDIVTFDVSRNQNLTELDFGNTEGRAGYGTTKGIISIDITRNPNLQRLYMQNNRLTALNLSGNPIMKEIWVHDNKIESLDCTRNPILGWFAVWNNNLRYLNIKGLPSIFIDRLYTYNNPNLLEIRVQSVQKLLQKKSDCGFCFNVDSWTKYVE